MALSDFGTEQVGVSAEVAIADICSVPINPSYRSRGKQVLVDAMTKPLEKVLTKIPKPIKHVAEDQNPVDFKLEGQKTLSVKTNMRGLGKMAPQNIGQPTSQTFWGRLPWLVPEGINIQALSYSDSAREFKKVALTRTSELLKAYWENLFDCDYVVHIYNVLNESDQISSLIEARIYNKLQSPDWQSTKISFSKNLENWNESCTIYYESTAIGEFQVHNNRNCFKFRFNLEGLLRKKLI